MTKVTVYIPTHNYGKYVEQAIESVLTQTMIDWELIVIDDGSTDNTKEVLAKYKDNEKIRIIYQENKGLNITNNIALRLSNGKYIIRLDADDYFEENILLVLSNVLDTKEEVGLVYPDYYHVTSEGEIIEIVRRKKIGEEVKLLDLPAHGACTMIRKECLLNLQGYEEEFSCQDGYELWLRFIQKHTPYNVNIPLFYYRQHPKSLTRNERKIIDTRTKIKKKFIDKHNNGKRPNVLGIVPVLSETIYPQNRPFTMLAGKPLIWYTVNEIMNAKTLNKVIVSTPDEDVIKYVEQNSNFQIMKRPKKLSHFSSNIFDTIKDVLYKLEKNENYIPDAVCILYISTPLRRGLHIDRAIDTLTIFETDSVISIQEEHSRFYKHEKYGLSPIKISKDDLRLEREAIYKENGAIFLTKTKVIKSGNLLGNTVGHITMLPEESVKINNNFDFWIVEQILKNNKVDTL